MHVLLEILKKNVHLLEYYNNITTNIEVNHAMQFIYKSVFNNHYHCVYIEKKKCE